MLEVCIDSIESAKNAIEGGAQRLEVCASLELDGLTPDIELVRAIRNMSDIPMHVMLRPRSGNFVYSHNDKALVINQLKRFKNEAIQGFVFGALTTDYQVDEDLCIQIRDLVVDKQLVFHRAIDYSSSYFDALETIIQIQYDEVLTSGHESTALKGMNNLIKAKKLSKGSINILAGGGINAKNAQLLIQKGINRLHGSFSQQSETNVKLTSRLTVQSVYEMLIT